VTTGNLFSTLAVAKSCRITTRRNYCQEGPKNLSGAALSTKVSTVNQKKGAIAGRTVQPPHPPMNHDSGDPSEVARWRWSGMTATFHGGPEFRGIQQQVAGLADGGTRTFYIWCVSRPARARSRRLS